uniref:Expansin-like protein 5 n=1 Tax=Anthurium amnicola TaxID=1678845 RepID=A0A1D1XZV4_9ARAE
MKAILNTPYILYILSFILSIITITTAEEGFVRRMDFSLKKRGATSAKMTFYDGDQLDNAACYGRDGIPSYNAKPSDMIAAMSIKNSNMCYQCLKVTNPKNKKSCIVKLIDFCAGCPKNNIDMTPTAFSSIANQDDGIVSIRWEPVSCPSKGRFPTLEKKKSKRNI